MEETKISEDRSRRKRERMKIRELSIPRGTGERLSMRGRVIFQMLRRFQTGEILAASTGDDLNQIDTRLMSMKAFTNS